MAQLNGIFQRADHHFLGQFPPPVVLPRRLLDLIIDAHFHFVPFHAAVRRFPGSPSQPALPHLPAVHQQHSQLTGLALRTPFLWHRFDPLLALLFGFGSGSLRQRVKLGVVHAATPFGRHASRALIRAGLNDREAEPFLQGRCHLLMRLYGPNLPLRAKPTPAAGFLPVIRFDLNPPDAAFQRQLSFLTAHQALGPQGKKTG